MSNHRSLLVITIIAFFCGWLTFCQTDKQATSHQPYRNLNDTVRYVGIQTCKGCHQDIYETYIHTGMGQSFDVASRAKSAASFDDSDRIYDPALNYYYKPYWVNDSLMVMEYRLNGGDTVHKRIERIHYIVGSGQHTNSHIIDINGYLYQAPVTFYTQKGTWDLAPGFSDGYNSRFDRTIEPECMTCHNHYPEFIEGSTNKYSQVPGGIECERCHGPGELHVREKLAGINVDTSQQPDYSIVNPDDLSVELQMSLCQRCHLQGVAVTREGKNFGDFKPGMALNEVMDVFIPRFEESDHQFIMASQADRLRQSTCYTVSGKMSCITCHNPHVSVKQSSNKNRPCGQCHNNAGKPGCTAPRPELESAAYDCVSCHMPASGSIDIPHVSITDHKIRTPVAPAKQEEIRNFSTLACMTREQPDPLLNARGYIAYHEKFSDQPALLDTAAGLLARVVDKKTNSYLKTKIHLHFLKEQQDSILAMAPAIDTAQFTDGWMFYRIGEAYYQKMDYHNSLIYYRNAIRYLKYNLKFQNKLGSVLVQLKRIRSAQQVFGFILRENPKFVPALSNLGYVYALKGQLKLAEAYYRQALALDPDYEPGLMNLAALWLYQQKKSEVVELMKRVLTINPANRQAVSILNSLLDS